MNNRAARAEELMIYVERMNRNEVKVWDIYLRCLVLA
jgi:hypothetical protein